MIEKLGERPDEWRAAGRTTQPAHADTCSNYDAAMIRRLSTLLLLAAVGVALLAGCGSGSSTSSAGTNTVTTNSSIATGHTGAPKATPQQEIAACQRAVQQLKSLSASTKARLKTSCEKIGIGEAGKRQVAREVCLELALRLTSPIARARAQKICSAP
jgi:hypothetical protein